jgi:hypothetical protein
MGGHLVAKQRACCFSRALQHCCQGRSLCRRGCHHRASCCGPGGRTGRPPLGWAGVRCRPCRRRGRDLVKHARKRSGPTAQQPRPLEWAGDEHRRRRCGRRGGRPGGQGIAQGSEAGRGRNNAHAGPRNARQRGRAGRGHADCGPGAPLQAAACGALLVVSCNVIIAVMAASWIARACRAPCMQTGTDSNGPDLVTAKPGQPAACMQSARASRAAFAAA